MLIFLLAFLGVLGASSADEAARVGDEPGAIAELPPVAAPVPTIPAVKAPPPSRTTCAGRRDRPRHRDLTVSFSARRAMPYRPQNCAAGSIDE